MSTEGKQLPRSLNITAQPSSTSCTPFPVALSLIHAPAQPSHPALSSLLSKLSPRPTPEGAGTVLTRPAAANPLIAEGDMEVQTGPVAVLTLTLRCTFRTHTPSAT